MCEWRRTRLFSLPYILVKGFQFYVQLFALWPKVVSEKKRQVAALVQTATFAHPKNFSITHARYLTKTTKRNDQTCRRRLQPRGVNCRNGSGEGRRRQFEKQESNHGRKVHERDSWPPGSWLPGFSDFFLKNLSCYPYSRKELAE